MSDTSSLTGITLVGCARANPKSKLEVAVKHYDEEKDGAVLQTALRLVSADMNINVAEFPSLTIDKRRQESDDIKASTDTPSVL